MVALVAGIHQGSNGPGGSGETVGGLPRALIAQERLMARGEARLRGAAGCAKFSLTITTRTPLLIHSSVSGPGVAPAREGRERPPTGGGMERPSPIVVGSIAMKHNFILIIFTSYSFPVLASLA